MKKISLVMPVKNGMKYIIESIDSVLEQNYQNLEIIIINDGSDDGDYTKFEKTDSRIRVVSTKGHGVSAARNLGFKLSSGEYICFLDADDVLAPGKLLCQSRFLDLNNDFDVVYGDVLAWRPHPSGDYTDRRLLLQDCSEVSQLDSKNSGFKYESLLCEEQIQIGCALIRRQLISAAGLFNEEMRIGEDQEWFIRLSRHAKMACLDAVVLLYRHHPSSAMGSHSGQENHNVALREIAIKKYGDRQPDGSKINKRRYNKSLAQYYFEYGYKKYRQGEFVLAKKSMAKSLFLRHRILKSTYFFCASHLILLNPYH